MPKIKTEKQTVMGIEEASKKLAKSVEEWLDPDDLEDCPVLVGENRFESLNHELYKLRVGQRLLAAKMEGMFRELYYSVERLQKANDSLSDPQIMDKVDKRLESLRDDAIDDVMDYEASFGSIEDPLGLDPLQLD